MPNLPEGAKGSVGKVRRSFNVTPPDATSVISHPFCPSSFLLALYIDNCAPKVSVFDISCLSHRPLGSIVDLVGRYIGLATLSQGFEACWGALVTLVSFFIAVLHCYAYADYLQPAALLRLVVRRHCCCFIGPSIAVLPLMLTAGFSFTLKAASPRPKMKIQLHTPGASTQQESNSVLGHHINRIVTVHQR